MNGWKPGWSVLYDTDVKRLLFLCGLKISEATEDSRPVWTIRRKPREI